MAGHARMSSAICPRYQVAIDLLGKRWTGLIVQALLGQPLRFGELSERLEVVGDRMLTERLKELEAAGVVERRRLDCSPVGVEYRLTPKGLALREVVEAISHWAEAWLDRDPGAAPEEEAPPRSAPRRERPRAARAR